MAVSSEMKEDFFLAAIGGVFENNNDDDDTNDDDEDLTVETEFYIQGADHIPLPTRKILLKHQLSSSVDLVGLQVWRGAFLLADYILYNHELFKNCRVLELAAGTGLTSIAAGLVAEQVISTDVDRGDILPLLRSNISSNSSKSNVNVIELDFFWDTYPDHLEKQLRACDVIIAADVVYDVNITRHFFKTLERLIEFGIKDIYIGIEQRLRTDEDGGLVAPNFEIFKKSLEALHLRTVRDRRLQVEELRTDFPKYFEYTPEGVDFIDSDDESNMLAKQMQFTPADSTIAFEL